MHPIATLVAGLFGGLVIGICVAWLVLRPRPNDLITDLEGEPPEVPVGVSSVLDVLSSSALVIGPHDEVLEATTSARTQGLARGSRVAVPEVLDLVRQVRRERAIRSLDLELVRGRGATSYLRVRVAPLPNDLVVVLADDQTSARRIEETRRDFVVNISHELKTPIGAISLLAEAAEDAADDPPAVRKFAGRLSVESARLSDLVSQIIDLSRLQADDPLGNAEEVDIDEVLAEAVDRCQVDAQQRQVSLTVAGTTGCRVLGSSRQLSVAVGNLVENAVVYSDTGARVVVAAHRQARSDDDYVEITVSDNGIGIPPGELERIFERFYRVDYARSRANGGTGLGLAIVKHIAASHGGEVSVWSQPGHGSTFTIRIPEHVGAQQTQERGSDAESEARAEDQESRI
ncbi:MAG TPA: ATP-binding protein [Propionibacteriaceae bacterium]|nr:ATP-binding protein [Propionibacteriaceae bacterium]